VVSAEVDVSPMKGIPTVNSKPTVNSTPVYFSQDVVEDVS
jgi:sorbitol-specific phosphotransferase system component IIBC